jgi:hypothetical protein
MAGAGGVSPPDDCACAAPYKINAAATTTASRRRFAKRALSRVISPPTAGYPDFATAWHGFQGKANHLAPLFHLFPQRPGLK